MQTKIDHLVIGAADLTQGVEYIRECFGVDIPFGGNHEKMGTHNHLMQIGDHVFLEIIAVDPVNPPPEAPRWYGLDDPHVRRQIVDRPSFLTWVVNTGSIRELLSQAQVSFGSAELIRRGNLSWYFGLPEDGRLLASGCLPYVIEWQTDAHPSTTMADLGCRLESLEIYHPYPCWLKSILDSINAAGLVEIHSLPRDEPPYVKAFIHSPKGMVSLQTNA